MAKKAGYGQVISARFATPKARKLAKIAKVRRVRVSDMLRIAADELIARHSQEAA